MTLAELRKNLPSFDVLRSGQSDRTDMIAFGSDDPQSCEQYEMGKGSGLVVMVESGLVTRITIYAPGILTAKGVQVGDPEATVLAAYGGMLVRRQSEFADKPAHDLYLWTAPTTGIRFGIDHGGDLAFIHAGGESIAYEEGCL